MNQVIHQAVRRDLERLELALADFPDGDYQRAQDLHRAYGHLCDQLTHHHEQEDRLIFPALGGLGVDAALLAEMETEHQAMAAGLADSADAMSRLAGSASAADATAARTSVARTKDIVDGHLTHEEADLEPLMADHVRSPGWKAVEKQLRRQPPSVVGPFFAWLQDGMTPEGRTYLDSTMPKPVLAVMSRVFGRRYSREIAPVWRG